MKKLWTLMMAMVFVLAVTGCGGEKAAEPAAGGEGQTSESGGGLKLKMRAPAAEPAAPAAEPAAPAAEPAAPAAEPAAPAAEPAAPAAEPAAPAEGSAK